MTLVLKKDIAWYRAECLLDRKLTWENKVLDHMKTENNLNGQSEHPLITIQEKNQLWEIIFCNVSKDKRKKISIYF